MGSEKEEVSMVLDRRPEDISDVKMISLSQEDLQIVPGKGRVLPSNYRFHLGNKVIPCSQPGSRRDAEPTKT